MTLLLGLDIGTTATKGVVIAPDGRVVARASRPSDLSSRRPGWAEEDPEQWWVNVVELCRQLGSTRDIAAVGVSGMVPCVIALDARGEPLRPSIQQNDARAAAEIDELRGRLDEERVLARTGSGITQQSVGPTLLWLQRHEPEVWAATATIQGSYDHVVLRLTGEAGVELNWALESGLYDLHRGTWAEDVLQACGCDPALLPPVRRPEDVVGKVTAEAARETSLNEGTPVVAGAADHVAAAFASGVVADGDLLIKLGGAGDILMATERPVIDRRLFLDHHLIPQMWMPNGCMASSGSLLGWFRDNLAPNASLEELDAAAAASRPGSRGILALPYFLGEKTPVHDPRARGAFVGLHLGHTRADLFRSLLEAVAFGFRHHIDVFAENGMVPTKVRVADGGSRSRLWVSILAGALARPVERVEVEDASALGAAFVAGVGTGVFASWREIERFVRVRDVIDPADTAVYDETYRRYRALYPALREVLA